MNDEFTLKIKAKHYLEALGLICTHGVASASFLERNMKIGMDEASNLIYYLEFEGLVGTSFDPTPRLINMRKIKIRCKNFQNNKKQELKLKYKTMVCSAFRPTRRK